MIKIKLFILFGLLISSSLIAQTLSDAIMMKSNQTCVLLDYNFSSFDHYWEGTLKRDNQTIATVNRRSVMPMMAIGILDNLNLFAGVPYIATKSTEPNGGQLAGASGFQDLTVAVKYRWVNLKGKNGVLAGLTTVGFSTPITKYLPDYMPYSIGMGAPELSYRAILEYKQMSNWYVRGAGAYLWRGYAKAEREYYYSDGSFYTPWMEVPNALTGELVLGKWLLVNSLQIELSYFNLRSLSGDDIRPYAMPKPTNMVNMERVGFFAHYYFKSPVGLGVIAYHNRVINGRNMAEMNTTGFGLTYFFNYLNWFYHYFNGYRLRLP